ncbi:MAG: YciI family protein [bacterium]
MSRGRQYVLVLLKQGTNQSLDSAAVVAYQEKHLMNLFMLKQQGKLPLFGPIAEESTLRGICIFNVADKAAARKLIEADPFVKSGALAYEIYDWFGLPGDVLPAEKKK